MAALVATGMLAAACGSSKKSEGTTAPAATTGGSTATTAGSPATTGSATATTGGATATTGGTTETTGGATATTGGGAGGEAWKVDTSTCADEAAAKKKITGTVNIGSVMPLTGGVAAAAFSPVADGFQAYVDYANQNKLLGDTQLKLTIEDDQYSKDLTPAAVSKLIDGGTHLISGIIGSPDNAAVRDTLNNECIPQLNAETGLPLWGDVKNYPWTTGILVPYDIESKIYAKAVLQNHPDGAKVALFYVNNEFGQLYAQAVKDLAEEDKLTIVDEQTIEATDSNPPTSQMTSIASKKPDAIIAAPLGAQCVTYLKELTAQKAQNAGWDPEDYVTNTCASSSLVLGAAGDAANGVITSTNGLDPGDPANANVPAMKTYLDFMAGRGKSDIVVTAAAGWALGEVTVAILKQAQDSADGLTRESIINAARNFDFTPSLAAPGVKLKSHGEKDPYLAQSLLLEQYDAATKTFTKLTDIITDYES